MLFAVHHQPYNIMMFFIELSGDREGFVAQTRNHLSFDTFLFLFFLLTNVVLLYCT